MQKKARRQLNPQLIRFIFKNHNKGSDYLYIIIKKFTEKALPERGMYVVKIVAPKGPHAVRPTLVGNPRNHYFLHY